MEPLPMYLCFSSFQSPLQNNSQNKKAQHNCDPNLSNVAKSTLVFYDLEYVGSITVCPASKHEKYADLTQELKYIYSTPISKT